MQRSGPNQGIDVLKGCSVPYWMEGSRGLAIAPRKAASPFWSSMLFKLDKMGWNGIENKFMTLLLLLFNTGVCTAQSPDFPSSAFERDSLLDDHGAHQGKVRGSSASWMQAVERSGLLRSTAPELDLQACASNRPSERLQGGYFRRQRKKTENGESVWIFYRKQVMVPPDVAGQDSLLFVELFQRNKSWNIYRYRLEDGKAIPQGTQLRFDRRGRLIEALECEEGQISCRRWQHFAWWPNDSLARSGWFDNGSADSLHQSWYDNGQLRSRMWYGRDRLVEVEGLWGPHGDALSTGTFEAGQGDLPLYSLSGNVAQMLKYRRGKVVKKQSVGPGQRE